MEWFIVIPLWILGYCVVGGITTFSVVKYEFNEAMKENRNSHRNYNVHYPELERANSKEEQIELNLKEASEDWGAPFLLWPLFLIYITCEGIGIWIKHGVAGKAIKEAKAEAEKARLDAITARILKEQDDKFDMELKGNDQKAGNNE
jgi:hypothetical protein